MAVKSVKPIAAPAAPITPAKKASVRARWPIDKLKPYANNARNNAAAIPVVARSLDEFGQKQDIVVEPDGTIIVGHTRWAAANMLGWSEVDVLIAYDLTPEQVKAYRLVDNRSNKFSEDDEAKIIAELSDIKDQGFDLKGMGFTDAELSEMEVKAKKEDTRYLEDFDVMPVPRPKWILISAPEDECAQIMGAVNAMGLTHVKMEYSGVPSEPMNHKTMQPVTKVKKAA